MPRLLAAAGFLFGLSVCARAQSFGSGSNGSDGALNLTTPGTVAFDPQSFTPALNPKGDNIFHFTTIHIGLGVTVKLSSKNLRGPVFWLAKGDVRIEGTVDLNGDDGAPYVSGTSRTLTIAGAGGYGGGIGALNGNVSQDGAGPGGGQPGQGGSYTGNKLLVPLMGGSGGGGTDVATGGAGGGALLIASSTSITLNGTISANGGNQSDRGFASTGGSGGAIRLVAPVITGSNALITARGGAASSGASSGQDGRIRLEAFQNDLRGDVNGTPISIGKPFKLFLPPDPPPSVSVVSVGGAPPQVTSDGSTALANATVNRRDPVVIVLNARYVQPGTKIRVHLYGDSGTDQELESTPLTGTYQLSWANAMVSLQTGTTRVAVEANWKLPPQTGK